MISIRYILLQTRVKYISNHPLHCVENPYIVACKLHRPNFRYWSSIPNLWQDLPLGQLYLCEWGDDENIEAKNTDIFFFF